MLMKNIPIIFFVYIIILFCFFIPPHQMMGQENINAFNRSFIPPTPQSEEFRKYDSPEPELTTGAINISIPLFDISYRGVNIPIQLQYRTNGIKVFDVSHPFGLGWTMTPGMRISRIILGRRDEGFKQPETVDDPNYNLMTMAMRFMLDGGEFEDTLNYVDTQHDIYTLHLLNESYSFLLDRTDNTINVISASDGAYRITANIRKNPESMSFKVTDGDGIDYFFGGHTENKGRKHITGWMIDSIKYPNNESICFEWEEMRSAPEYHYDFFTIDDCFDYDSERAYDDQGFEEAEVSNIQILKQIRYPLGRIDFEYTGAANSYMKEMTVTNTIGDTIEHVYLSYDSIDHRTKLLQQVDTYKEGSYQMTYNRTRISNMYAQDWWGFYNGKNNDRLYPSMSLKYDEFIFLNNSIGNGSILNTMGGDRNVDTVLMKANILTRVDYPTGGWTAFEYEPHQFVQPDLSSPRINNGANIPMICGGGLRISKVTTGGIDISNPLVTTYKYGSNENGLANVISFPSPKSFFNDYFDYKFYYYDPDNTNIHIKHFRHTIISSFPHNMDWHIFEPSFWYSQVSVKQADGGKKVLNFNRLLKNWTNNLGTGTSTGQLPESDWTFEMPTHLNSIFSKGILLDNEQEYKIEGNQYEYVKSIDNSYWVFNNETENPIHDVAIKRRVASSAPGQIFAPDVIMDEQHMLGNLVHSRYDSTMVYQPFEYEISQKSEHLMRTTIRDVAENDTLTKTIEYGYTKYGLVSSLSTIQGEDSITMQYTYPFEHDNTRTPQQQSMADSLTSSFIVNNPVKTKKSRNGFLVSTEWTDYKIFYGQCLPWRNYIAKGADTLLVREMDYDKWGNIISMTTLGDKKEAVIWDSKGQFPMFHVIGARFDELMNTSGFSLSNLQDTTRMSESFLWLRSALPSCCSVEAFAYKPMVGRTLWIAPNGACTRYHYDNKWRLSGTSLDEHGQINEYIYRRHNESNE